MSPGPVGLEVAATAIRDAGNAAIQTATTLDELHGHEGAAAASYFGTWKHLVRGAGFSFDRRNRRPPMDPVNALLSLGYSLLSTTVHAMVEVVGLDPYVGALHSPKAGRASLVCDLVEEFRAPLVDALVLATVNKGMLSPDDFETTAPDEPVVIKHDAVRTFIGLYERRLAARVLYVPLAVHLDHRMVIEQQVRAFARLMTGEAATYLPFAMR